MHFPMASRLRVNEMSVLSELPKRAVRVSWLSLSTPAPVLPGVRSAWRRWLILALLGGYFLFCHGCHGDEDNELLGALGSAGSFMAAALPSESVGPASALSVPAARWKPGYAALVGSAGHPTDHSR